MKKPVQPKRTRKNAAITKMLAEVDGAQHHAREYGGVGEFAD